MDFSAPEFHLSLSPEKDPFWPSVFAYGDCSSCDATLSTPVNLALNIKSVGIGFCIAGASAYGVLCLLVISNQLRKKSGPGNELNSTSDLSLSSDNEVHQVNVKNVTFNLPSAQ